MSTSVQSKHRKRAESSNAVDFHLNGLNNTKSADVMNHKYDLNGGPPPLHHASSDPWDPFNNNGKGPTYEVRPCRVEDTDSIDSIMRNAWPGHYTFCSP